MIVTSVSLFTLLLIVIILWSIRVTTATRTRKYRQVSSLDWQYAPGQVRKQSAEYTTYRHDLPSCVSWTFKGFLGSDTFDNTIQKCVVRFPPASDFLVNSVQVEGTYPLHKTCSNGLYNVIETQDGQWVYGPSKKTEVHNMYNTCKIPICEPWQSDNPRAQSGINTVSMGGMGENLQPGRLTCESTNPLYQSSASTGNNIQKGWCPQFGETQKRQTWTVLDENISFRNCMRLSDSSGSVMGYNGVTSTCYSGSPPSSVSGGMEGYIQYPGTAVSVNGKVVPINFSNSSSTVQSLITKKVSSRQSYGVSSSSSKSSTKTCGGGTSAAYTVKGGVVTKSTSGPAPKCVVTTTAPLKKTKAPSSNTSHVQYEAVYHNVNLCKQQCSNSKSCVGFYTNGDACQYVHAENGTGCAETELLPQYHPASTYFYSKPCISHAYEKTPVGNYLSSSSTQNSNGNVSINTSTSSSFSWTDSGKVREILNLCDDGACVGSALPYYEKRNGSYTGSQCRKMINGVCPTNMYRTEASEWCSYRPSTNVSPVTCVSGPFIRDCVQKSQDGNVGNDPTTFFKNAYTSVLSAYNENKKFPSVTEIGKNNKLDTTCMSSLEGIVDSIDSKGKQTKTGVKVLGGSMIKNYMAARLMPENWPKSKNTIPFGYYTPPYDPDTVAEAYTTVPNTTRITNDMIYSTVDAPRCSGTATAVAVLGGGSISSIVVTNGGRGYVTVPRVTIQGASATAKISNGSVVSVSVSNAGSGLSKLPAVIIESPSLEWCPPVGMCVKKGECVGYGASSNVNLSKMYKPCVARGVEVPGWYSTTKLPPPPNPYASGQAFGHIETVNDIGAITKVKMKNRGSFYAPDTRQVMIKARYQSSGTGKNKRLHQVGYGGKLVATVGANGECSVSVENGGYGYEIGMSFLVIGMRNSGLYQKPKITTTTSSQPTYMTVQGKRVEIGKMAPIPCFAPITNVDSTNVTACCNRGVRLLSNTNVHICEHNFATINNNELGPQSKTSLNYNAWQKICNVKNPQNSCPVGWNETFRNKTWFTQKGYSLVKNVYMPATGVQFSPTGMRWVGVFKSASGDVLKVSQDDTNITILVSSKMASCNFSSPSCSGCAPSTGCVLGLAHRTMPPESTMPPAATSNATCPSSYVPSSGTKGWCCKPSGSSSCNCTGGNDFTGDVCATTQYTPWSEIDGSGCVYLVKGVYNKNDPRILHAEVYIPKSKSVSVGTVSLVLSPAFDKITVAGGLHTMLVAGTIFYAQCAPPENTYTVSDCIEKCNNTPGCRGVYMGGQQKMNRCILATSMELGTENDPIAASSGGPYGFFEKQNPKLQFANGSCIPPVSAVRPVPFQPPGCGNDSCSKFGMSDAGYFYTGAAFNPAYEKATGSASAPVCPTGSRYVQANTSVPCFHNGIEKTNCDTDACVDEDGNVIIACASNVQAAGTQTTTAEIPTVCASYTIPASRLQTTGDAYKFSAFPQCNIDVSGNVTMVACGKPCASVPNVKGDPVSLVRWTNWALCPDGRVQKNADGTMACASNMCATTAETEIKAGRMPSGGVCGSTGVPILQDIFPPFYGNYSSMGQFTNVSFTPSPTISLPEHVQFYCKGSDSAATAMEYNRRGVCGDGRCDGPTTPSCTRKWSPYTSESTGLPSNTILPFESPLSTAATCPTAPAVSSCRTGCAYYKEQAANAAAPSSPIGRGDVVKYTFLSTQTSLGIAPNITSSLIAYGIVCAINSTLASVQWLEIRNPFPTDFTNVNVGNDGYFTEGTQGTAWKQTHLGECWQNATAGDLASSVPFKNLTRVRPDFRDFIEKIYYTAAETAKSAVCNDETILGFQPGGVAASVSQAAAIYRSAAGSLHLSTIIINEQTYYIGKWTSNIGQIWMLKFQSGTGTLFRGGYSYAVSVTMSGTKLTITSSMPTAQPPLPATFIKAGNYVLGFRQGYVLGDRQVTTYRKQTAQRVPEVFNASNPQSGRPNSFYDAYNIYMPLSTSGGEGAYAWGYQPYDMAINCAKQGIDLNYHMLNYVKKNSPENYIKVRENPAQYFTMITQSPAFWKHVCQTGTVPKNIFETGFKKGKGNAYFVTSCNSLLQTGCQSSFANKNNFFNITQPECNTIQQKANTAPNVTSSPAFCNSIASFFNEN